LNASVEKSERRVALGFSPEIPLKAGCKPALQLFCPAPCAQYRAGVLLKSGGMEGIIAVLNLQ
jgi:hypothetical protein